MSFNGDEGYAEYQAEQYANEQQDMANAQAEGDVGAAMADDPNVMRGVKCKVCNGDGYAANRNPSAFIDDPIQVPCENCKGFGYIE